MVYLEGYCTVKLTPKSGPWLIELINNNDGQKTTYIRTHSSQECSLSTIVSHLTLWGWLTNSTLYLVSLVDCSVSGKRWISVYQHSRTCTDSALYNLFHHDSDSRT